MQVSLVMFKADGSRRDFPLDKKRTLMGRTSTCDLRIPLSSVSREHCELVIDENAVAVRDLGSSNGTFLNESRIKEATLEPGDRLVVGPVVFTVVGDGNPDRVKPVRSIMRGAAADDAGRPPPGADAASEDASTAMDALAGAGDDSDELPLLAEEK